MIMCSIYVLFHHSYSPFNYSLSYKFDFKSPACEVCMCIVCKRKSQAERNVKILDILSTRLDTIKMLWRKNSSDELKKNKIYRQNLYANSIIFTFSASGQ